MKKLKVALVDDEENARLLLRSMLNEYHPEIEIVAEACNVMEAIKCIHQFQPEVIFLDIEMPGHSGLELIEFFDKEKFQCDIVFVTAYAEFAINAFEQSATDYLLKPIRKEKLDRTVEKLKEKHLISRPQIIQQQGIKDKVALQSSEGITLIDPDDIIYLKADGSYTHFFLTDQRKLTVAKSLNEFVKLESKGFLLRVHRSYMININRIQKVMKLEKGTLVMQNNEEISISQEKRQELIQLIDQFKL